MSFKIIQKIPVFVFWELGFHELVNFLILWQRNFQPHILVNNEQDKVLNKWESYKIKKEKKVYRK